MTADIWQYRESMAMATKGVDLSGFEVVGRDGPLGVIDEASNDVRMNYIIVDTGDWYAGHQVLLPAGTVERVDPPSRQVFVDRTKEQVRQAPEYDKSQKRSQSFQDSLSGYYHGLYDVGL